jgi:ATP-dependent Clp protease ATP-binding subunit ClpA
VPDKAIDVIDEAGAYRRLQPGDAAEGRRRRADPEHRREDRTDSAEERIGVGPRRAALLERDLKLVIFGQDRAINALGAAIKWRAQHERRPVGSFRSPVQPASARPRSRGSSR